MASLTTLAAVASAAAAGASVVGTVRQAQAQRAAGRAQAEIARQQEQSRQEQLVAQRDADAGARQQTLARTVAAARARLAAGGVAPDEGSAAAITAGLEQTAAAQAGASDEVFRARLAAGRPSLLNPDGTLTALLQSGRTITGAARSLLG